MTFMTQRWRDTRGVYRPVGDPIAPDRYTVTRISYQTAKHFVCQHHYSRSFPQMRFAFGLYEHDQHWAETELVGVLTLGIGATALTNVFPGLDPGHEALELNRLVLLDRVPANAESFFVARALRSAVDDGICGITTFCDPSGFWQPTTGSLVHRGHYDCVYQALNMTYIGRSRASWKFYLPSGIEISRRALTKAAGRPALTASWPAWLPWHTSARPRPWQRRRAHLALRGRSSPAEPSVASIPATTSTPSVSAAIAANAPAPSWPPTASPTRNTIRSQLVAGVRCRCLQITSPLGGMNERDDDPVRCR
ncbi:Mom family adenine methylcarbamoylation protein [Nocardia pseudovaccinii]|uniref:Mom family adenine methylcarbamoylation protein n=1 Tax=Nocardia pseudovaccinii TaxID=189540 RepID=UPI0007A415F6|nr:hypothetical protein [Nocardia pseudovaccinii]